MIEEVDSDGEECWVPYSERADWADVTPLHVNDGRKVVAIKYNEKHIECMSFFRAIMAAGELSERVLELTADLIALNSADYTAWQYRCVPLLRPFARR